MDPLYELLAPYFDRPESPSDHLPPPSPSDLQTGRYLTRLSTLSLSDLASTEPASLLYSAQSHLRSLQALSKRSQKAVIASSSHLSNLTSILPSLDSQTKTLHDEIPELERAATSFATKYSRSTENAVLDRRKRTMLLARNADRVSDVLELPSLLSSTVSAAVTSATASSSSTSTSYATALDLHAHIRRLNTLYPNLRLVGGIMGQAESEIQNLTTILVNSLQSPSLKLAGAMRTIGWLRRVAPDLAEDGYAPSKSFATSAKALTVTKDAQSEDGALGSMFLICRLRTLHTTLDALDPLRELADQEATRRKQGLNSKLLKQQVSASALGSQSERYLKRYIEIFREQTFNIIGMYKSIFPSALPTFELGQTAIESDTPPALPSPLASFAMHLIGMLAAELQLYLPNIADKQARESLLTQVLYCAGSLGRQGADFGMMIALLEAEMDMQEDSEDGSRESAPEWEQVMKKHRIQASRLEILSRGVGGRKASRDILSPPPVSA